MTANIDRHTTYNGILDYTLNLLQITDEQLASLTNQQARDIAYQIAERAAPGYNIPWPQLRDGIKHNLMTRVYKARGRNR